MLSKKYIAALEKYKSWSRCSTPFDNFPAMSRKNITVEGDPTGLSAAEWLFSFETHGKTPEKNTSEPELLSIYLTGKAMRDWWNKEIRDWKRLGCAYVEEEFLYYLIPECFFELFGHQDRGYLVNAVFNNNYSEADFLEDCRMYMLGLAREIDGWRVIDNINK